MAQRFDNVRLEKGMYHEAGRSFTQVLEKLDPSEQYRGTALEGLDALVLRHQGALEGKTASRLEGEYLSVLERTLGELVQAEREGSGTAEKAALCLRAVNVLSQVISDAGQLQREWSRRSLEAEVEALERLGKMPLPPYIKAELADGERYQTVYSKVTGSAAAPTAGLHFTRPLLEQLQAMGVRVCYVTLHVGLGTFRPVKAENITDHHMHLEHYTVPEETARLVNAAKAEGRRVIAVGTTSCRTLESAWKEGALTPGPGSTGIFIYPGYRFQVLDGLITNFHLPESTLIMLVSAFAGYESTMNAYREAVQERYRFFSFGDAMFIGDMR